MRNRPVQVGDRQCSKAEQQACEFSIILAVALETSLMRLYDIEYELAFSGVRVVAYHSDSFDPLEAHLHPARRPRLDLALWHKDFNLPLPKTNTLHVE